MKKKKIFNLKPLIIPVFLAVLALVLIPAFIRVIKPSYIVSHYTLSFQNPLDFTYDISKVNLNSSGASLINKNDVADIISVKPLAIPKNSQILSFKENADKKAGAKISYQITTDNLHWYYFDGAKWRMAGASCHDCTNNISELNKNISHLPVSTGNFQIKVYLSSTSGDIPVLHSIDLLVQKNESDSASQTDKTEYVFQTSLVHSYCGNGVVDPGEQCDDGNNNQNDFCTNQCENQTPICHATGSHSNPYNFLWVDDSAIDGQGSNDHTHHPGDIIPITDVNQDGTIDEDDCTATPPVNLPPIANNDSATTLKNTPTTINVLTNDSDPDGTLVPSSVAVTVNPNHGTITNINTSTGAITYAPANNYTGIDTFTYKVCDNDGLCSTATVTVTINAPPVATINAYKIVCDKESYLPNWGNGGANITANTASNYVAASNGHCTLSSGWGFQWNHSEKVLSGDYVGEGSSNDGWHNFSTTTSGSNPAQALLTAQDINNDDEIWFREVLQDNYIPFSSPPKGLKEDNVTAEFYCNTDVLNYDNLEWIDDMAVNHIYYCVGFNALKTPTPVCGNEIVEQGEQCDDGNTANGDGCSSTCQTEENEKVTICHRTGSENHPWNVIEINTDAIPAHQAHGDIIPITDRNGDGNIDEDDCTYTPPVTLVCGNGIVEQGEECDDNNTNNGDGCSSTCQIEHNEEITICHRTGSENHPWVVITIDEDAVPAHQAHGDIIPITDRNGDGNIDEDDCTYTPPGSVCGNGVIEQGEQCDDGNTTNGDGCSSTCQIEETKLPPNAVDDSVTTSYETAIVIDVLANDTDPDGMLDPSTVIVTIGPTNGAISDIDPATGKITYTPNTGYYGTDTFEYRVCDNNGLCDTATVTITIQFVPPATYTSGGGSGSPPPPPTPIEPTPSEIVTTIIPPLIVPLVIPPIVPPAPVANTIGINPEFCGGRIFTTPDIIFVGVTANPASSIAETQYSLDNGVTWTTTLNVPPFDSTGGLFNFSALGLKNGVYTAQARMTSLDGTITNSTPCAFSVAAGELMFGANQFVRADSYSPVSANGVIQFAVGEIQTFYLEAKNATSAYVEATPTSSVALKNRTRISETQRFNLTYDSNLELWKGNIFFGVNGTYKLTGYIANSLKTYSREINTVYVSSQAQVTDSSTGLPIAGATATVYIKNIDNNSFIIWNGSAYGQPNPSQTNEKGELTFFLPRGEYYLKIEKDGYNSVTSLITTVNEYSSIEAKVAMSRASSFINQLFSNVGVANFPLIVTPVPETSLLKNGQSVPDITLTKSDGSSFSLFSNLASKPTIIMVYNSWNTLSQEQLGIFVTLKNQLGDQYQYYPISTLEPTQTSSSYISRGDYGLEVFSPNEKFFNDYSIISLPHFIILNENNKFIGDIVGPYSAGELEKMINGIINP